MKAEGVSDSDPELLRARAILQSIQQKTEWLKRHQAAQVQQAARQQLTQQNEPDLKQPQPATMQELIERVRSLPVPNSGSRRTMQPNAHDDLDQVLAPSRTAHQARNTGGLEIKFCRLAIAMGNTTISRDETLSDEIKDARKLRNALASRTSSSQTQFFDRPTRGRQPPGKANLASRYDASHRIVENLKHDRQGPPPEILKPDSDLSESNGSGRSGSVTPPLVREYYERRGDIGIFRDRLIDLDYTYEEGKAEHEFLRDRWGSIDAPDSQFEFENYTSRRQHLLDELQAAEDDVVELEKQCKRAGLTILHRE